MKLFGLIWYLIKALIFDSPNEYNPMSIRFNWKKTLAAGLMMLSITSAGFLAQRSYVIASKNLELSKKIKTLEAKQCLTGVENLPVQSSDRQLKTGKQ